MKIFEKRAWLTFTALFFSVQLWHTFSDQNNWPFCSYNMFSNIRPRQSQTYKIRLYETTGETHLVDVWEVLPLEFFRAISVVREVLVRGSDTEKQEALAAYILTALNDSPWSEFDQTYASVRPKTHFVGFELLKVDLASPGSASPGPRKDHPLHPADRRGTGEAVLFSYRAP